MKSTCQKLACVWLLSFSLSTCVNFILAWSKALPACRRIHMHAHTHWSNRSFLFWPMADGRAGTTIKYGFTSCFHRQAANYLQVPVAACCELPPTGSINLTSFGPPAYPPPLFWQVPHLSTRLSEQIEVRLVHIQLSWSSWSRNHSAHVGDQALQQVTMVRHGEREVLIICKRVYFHILACYLLVMLVYP